MQLAILHLSDFHISGADNQILGKVDSIRAAVQPNISGECVLLLACTGDIAYSGSKQQYEIATQFLGDLLVKLGQIPHVKILGSAIVPGNHDCDFSSEGDVRPVLLGTMPLTLDGVDLDGDSVQQLVKVQAGFFDFENVFCGRGGTTARSRVSWTLSFSDGREKVVIYCLNTALFSRLKEAPGQLYFPVQAVPPLERDSDLAVTLFHHPYGWFAPDNSRQLRRRLELQSDLILSGHEHDVDSYIRIAHGGDETGYVEGAAAQEADDSGFNLVVVNTSASTYQVYPFKWSDDIYLHGPPAAHVFVRKRPLIDSQFRNNPEFTIQLRDVGTGFSHPSRALTLWDLFVYPELRPANISGKNRASVQSRDVLSYVFEREHLHIAGAPLSGKSTLARALYLDLQRIHGLVPILLNGSELVNLSTADFEKTVQKAFAQQYDAETYERFRQLDRGRKVVLIDDWHRWRRQDKVRRQVLEKALDGFGRVVVFSDDASILQMLTDAAESGGAPAGEYCEIRQFGYRLRSELIRKWHSVGDDMETDDLELTHRISNSENLLDTLVGKGIVPSWPVFILSMLQAKSEVVPETASYGSYGHLYEALLTRRMADFSKKPTLGLKYTYLSIVAYELFVRGTAVLTEGELRRLHRRYEVEYKVTVDSTELWGELAGAQVLVRSGDEFRFQYKYAYYFFVAKYFQQGIGNVTEASLLREQLSEMVRCVHDEDYANILIFYLYLTKDRDLIEKMLAVASRVFSDTEPANLTTDIEFVNALRDTPPDVLLEKGDIEDNRNEYRSRLDSSEGVEQPAAAVMVRTEYRDDITDALKVEFAFKSLQVMGQVVKNFPLDLKGDLKLALTQQSYELTLRVLHRFLSFIESNMAGFIAFLEDALRHLEPFSKKSPEALREASAATVVRLAELAIFGMIKRLSLAVGVADLGETYSQVREVMGEDRVAPRLIDLSIKLDHFGRIPQRDVEQLEHLLRNNITAYTVLKLLVAEFLNLFPCDYKTEQRMVQLFKFQPHIAKLATKQIK